MGTSVSSQKSALRKRLLKRRAKLGGPLHGEALLPHWPDSLAVACVAGYYPMRGEFDCRPLLQTLRLAGVVTALPNMTGKGEPLIFREWVRGEPLSMGAYGVKEPSAEARIVSPDVVMVPLLAFDSKGGRLGYGGGYYDRTLATHPAALAVGIAFDEQEIDAIPVEAHDQRLDAVLCPSGFRGFILPKSSYSDVA